ncbi:hypothetical protein DFH29DRAFT_1036801 [Suillus ampliporus]|nr:hypothetical protein DFH29DRAFT_1036801 [Suillus ampliporus]
MAHSRNLSDLSDLSDLSTPESVISFNSDVNLAMQDAQISTATYADRARQVIDLLATRQERWIKTPPSVQDVEASRVLDAMLRNARETGGENSERYTACAISACQEIHEQVDLARTWFMYLLWPFTAGSHRPSDPISSQATPTSDSTLISVTTANFQRRSGFRSDVNRRDGYRCSVTGMWDRGHMPAGSDQVVVTLNVAHILKRVVGIFNVNPTHSAAATWDIIRHYSGLSEETIQNMESLMDDPSNGMMLEYYTHTAFDEFKVYLEQTERDNEYIVKKVDDIQWIRPELVGKTITFRNHAVPERNLPLPNPYFIALHAGICRILHMSAASEVFAQILDKFDGATGGKVGILKSNGDPVHHLSSMMSALSICAPLIPDTHA